MLKTTTSSIIKDRVLQTLDAEIAIYRKMLEGEENRAGLRQLVEQVVRTHGIKQDEETGTPLFYFSQSICVQKMICFPLLLQK